MKNHKLKKIKRVIISLLILTILIISIGLSLICFYNLQDNIKYIPCYYNYHAKQEIIIQKNGFILLKEYGLNYILNNTKLNCSKHYLFQHSFEICNIKTLLQLQIGIIFSVILSPILIFIITLLFFLTIGLKVKIKNNNFWDVIQNCEIINNHYIH